jgi:predicted DNA-binding transcriptional regulator YafY
MFDINIECDKRNNTYYIADAEGMLGDKLKMWLLNSFSLNNVLQENVDMKNRIVFEEVPSGVQFMDLVIDAMRSGRVLAMEYQAYNWEHSKDVLLEPYFVKLFRHRWYLIGINREYKAFRSYSLDRIKRIALSEETFNFPRKFTPQDHFRDSFGIIRDENLLPQHTVLRTTISQAPYLRNLPLHSSQKEIAVTESYVDFELYISHTYDFIQELLSKGAAVEVLKPQSLRDKIKVEIQNMQTLYRL